MKVKHLANNQFIIQDKNGNEIFQSYNSKIALKQNGKVFLDKNYWNYSKTTSKYRNIFLTEDIKTTKEKIKNGEYKLINLN